eukprot:4864826-Pyramimonas_sp.AAC.1
MRYRAAAGLHRLRREKAYEACSHLGFCPDRVFGAPVTQGHDAEVTDQNEVDIAEEEQPRVRMLQKGTKPQLIAGKRSAFVTGKSGAQPRLVS